MKFNEEHKLGVVVPYRNRPEQLSIFKDKISKYLYSKGIHHEVIVVEQLGDQSFNRGLLCNWGFRKAVWAGCDYVVFHDVDMIPEEVDYSYSETPIHLVTDVGDEELNDQLFYDYFGGVTMFPVKHFEKINGFSNDYWGWGFEDDDLFLRCQEKRIKNDFKIWEQRRHAGVGLEFNGKDSYVAIPNPLKPNKSFTVFGSFTIDGIDCNIDNEFDEMHIFSFPGNDIGLTYRSFMNFSFQLWDSYLEPHSIYTKKYPFGSYNYCATFDFSKDTTIISLYINGEFVGSKEMSDLMQLDQRYIYLGVGNPERKGGENYFKGLINNFAIYNDVLSKKEIQEISNNTKYSLYEFNSRKNLTLYFDSKFINGYQFVDLVGRNRSIIKNCKKVEITEETTKKVPVPFRRPGIFQSLPHDITGFDESWTDWSSRVNQYKYFKILKKKKTNSTKDGLFQYWGELQKEENDFNYNHIYVET